MTQNDTETIKRIERYPDGNIPAPQKYIDYGGQLVIRTRYGTLQRWKESGVEGRQSIAPYILHSDYCTGQSDDLDPMNEHLEGNQFEVYYVNDGDRVTYEIEGHTPK